LSTFDLSRRRCTREISKLNSVNDRKTSLGESKNNKRLAAPRAICHAGGLIMGNQMCRKKSTRTESDLDQLGWNEIEFNLRNHKDLKRKQWTTRGRGKPKSARKGTH